MSDLGKRGKIEEAKSLLHERKKRGLKPNVVTYNILLNYIMCKGGRVSLTEAYKVWIEMRLGCCKLNAGTYRRMADGFCRAGDFEGGLRVLNAMLACRHALSTFRNI
ncbi:hypothetical protein CIPAW_13G100400 [Carya illinoinensis]|uniref:Pentatricopeptide repeat-containing protein n=1 Tax=Carya illinoinensis TaxID=32201 RepID=A0A8T1NQW7_CARIL|nr:hypothetical protein CIPAW_13G100400 [Carya illinoinensis]